MSHAWPHREEALLATTLSDQTGRRYHLTVEILPHLEWEWVVWRAGDADQAVQHGVAPSVDAAMAAAEGAAGGLTNGLTVPIAAPGTSRSR